MTQISAWHRNPVNFTERVQICFCSSSESDLLHYAQYFAASVDWSAAGALDGYGGGSSPSKTGAEGLTVAIGIDWGELLQVGWTKFAW